jgi:hypothetical protein
VKVGYNDGWRDISPKFEAKWLDDEGCLEKVETAWKEASEEDVANSKENPWTPT